jgi:sugar phosphate isomerase/epimerase
MLTRRATLGLLGGIALARGGTAATPVQLGYQLYSSRKFGPRAATLAMLADLGYGHVETSIPLAGDRSAPARLADELAAAGLGMPSAQVDLDLLADDPGSVIEAARILGIGSVYAAWLPADRRPADGDGWTAFGAELEALARPLRQAGIAFGWHNHDYEFAVLSDGRRVLDAIFAGGPSLEWQADVGWIARAGADPVAWASAYAARITSVHLKDVARMPGGAEGGWADVGAGVVPWPALLPVLARAAPRTWIVEHDDPADDARFAAASIAFLRANLGVGR